MTASEIHTGTIRFWRDNRGFGFIRSDAGDDEVYVDGDQIDTPFPQEGDRVSYTAVRDKHGRGMRAVKVQVLR